jgi:hypothetical protein
MGPHEVTRRQLLAGLTVTGGAGLGIGSGTAALVTDSAMFPGNAVAAGALDLQVSWTAGSASGTGQGRASIPLAIGQSDGPTTAQLSVTVPADGENNPAACWLRARCPDDSLLGRALRVTITYDSCPDDCVLYRGHLVGLADGVPLDPRGLPGIVPGEQACLEPGAQIDLELTVAAGGFEGQAETAFELEFVGQQCRGREEHPNPFPAPDCGPPPTDGQHAISFLAFCTAGDGPIATDPETVATVTETNAAGEPLEIEWETDLPVDFVVVKASTEFMIYDLRDSDATTGVATSRDSDAAVATVEPAQRWASDPCGLAAQVLELPDYEPGATLKLEAGDWNSPEVDQ